MCGRKVAQSADIDVVHSAAVAKRERIKKLAKRLRVEPEVVVRTLRELGETRYTSAADILPADVASRVAAALSLAGVAQPPPAPQPRPAQPEPAVAPEPRAEPEPEREPEPTSEPLSSAPSRAS